MINEELGFVAAVCAAPADDTARLVYADWLQENDRPERAEFIRVQVELAAIPNPPAEPPSPLTRPEHHDQLLDFLEWRSRWRTPYYDLRRRERELLRRVWGAIGETAPLSSFVCDGISLDVAMFPRVTFTRGFVSALTCTAEDWLRHADALYWHPGQTVECPTCEGTTQVYIYGANGRRIGGGMSTWKGSTRGGWPVAECPRCRNTEDIPTGTVPRPCPATAQPLERVTLTTFPELSLDWVTTLREGNVWRIAKWPGVEFTLPLSVQELTSGINVRN